jgi:hypothetical protein
VFAIARSFSFSDEQRHSIRRMIEGYAIHRASAITGRFTNVSIAYFTPLRCPMNERETRSFAYLHAFGCVRAATQYRIERMLRRTSGQPWPRASGRPRRLSRQTRSRSM